jgi:pentapeptide MXKDX repeat protein
MSKLHVDAGCALFLGMLSAILQVDAASCASHLPVHSERHAMSKHAMLEHVMFMSKHAMSKHTMSKHDMSKHAISKHVMLKQTLAKRRNGTL